MTTRSWETEYDLVEMLERHVHAGVKQTYMIVKALRAPLNVSKWVHCTHSALTPHAAAAVQQ